MNRALSAAVLSAVLFTVTGCASNAIVGHRLTRESDWFGQLGVTGHLNKVTIRGVSRLTRLSVIGDANTIVVEDGATLGKIEIWGANNTISLPENLVIREAIMGKTNKLIRRPLQRQVFLEAPLAGIPATRPSQAEDASEP
jgi:hypothetical protein